MKRRQIKNRDDLPSEFDVGKYAPTKDFGIVEWTVNLEWRCLTIFMERFNEPEEQSARVEYVLKNPTSTTDYFEHAPGLKKYVESRSVLDFEAQDFYWHGVECATDSRYNEYMSGFSEFIEDTSPYDEKEGRYPDVIKRMEAPHYELMEQSGIQFDGNVLAKVDLHTSDEKLVADFVEWLKTTRERTGINVPKKKFTKDDFRTWSRSAILPYLDLTSWARANRVEITQQLLGTALFPDEYSVNLAERIRKVTAPMARSLAREVVTDALRGQALEEIAERKTEKMLPDKFAAFTVPDRSSDK